MVMIYWEISDVNFHNESFFGIQQHWTNTDGKCVLYGISIESDQILSYQ